VKDTFHQTGFLDWTAIVGMTDDPDELEREPGHGLAVEEELKPELKQPSLYQVYLINDDYTPMDFVVHVLEQFFGLGKEKATQIMLQVHYRGRGICGVYTYDIAETKVNLVNDYSRENQHPLLCSMEEL